MNADYSIELVTPLFSYGVVDDKPEIRASSIRGMLHWWFRALNGSYSQEREVFGGIGGKTESSRLVVRVQYDENPNDRVNSALLLHEGKSKRSSKKGVRIGTSFRVKTLLRRPFIAENADALQEMLDRTITAWMMLGSLGNRSTRGAGALFCSTVQPAAFSEYLSLITELISGAPLAVYVHPEPFNDPEEVRTIITNTIGGHSHGKPSLQNIGHPLGTLKPQRKTSPLRLTVRRFEDGFRLVAVWDERQKVTGNSFDHLSRAVEMMKSAGKPLGNILPVERKSWIVGKQ